MVYHDRARAQHIRLSPGTTTEPVPSTDYNDATIRAYNLHANNYLQQTPKKYDDSHSPLLKWIDTCLSLLEKNAKILEIGSGSGRDADYIQSKGFDIQRSDATHAFVQRLKEDNKEPILLNILTDDIDESYNLIFANAVIQHFTLENFYMFLDKVYNALPASGLMAFSARQGFGHQWVTEKIGAKRYMHFWQPDSLQDILSRFGFSIVYCEGNSPGDLPSHTWIHLIAK